eukprot:SAG31_NODE_23478_length_503_cov_1.279703_1_plen_44_part_10
MLKSVVILRKGLVLVFVKVTSTARLNLGSLVRSPEMSRWLSVLK